jgi:hypothetical protein
MATFTALNGGESRPAEASSGTAIASRPDAEERSGTAVAGQELKAPTETGSNQREHWSGPSAEDSMYQSTPGYPDAEGSHKRKRSDPNELRRGAPPGTEDRTPRHQSQPEAHEPHGIPQRDREYRPYGEGSREHNDIWYSQQQQQQQQQHGDERQAGPIPPQADEQMGDSMRRSPNTMDPQQNYSPTSPDDDDSSFYGGQYGSDPRRDGSVVQSDPKKRKRNFSNRTKTGCLTCRKRKKKCDETKPQCRSLPSGMQLSL